jgi:hypothetical protein
VSDYLWNFPTTGLALALGGLDALRVELGLDATALFGNALGDPRDANGDVVAPNAGRDITDPPPPAPAWYGRPGTAAYSYEDPLLGKTVDVPALGDPACYYMHIRTILEASAFDPAAYGLMPTDPAESAAVLGLWAGDAVPEGI